MDLGRSRKDFKHMKFEHTDQSPCQALSKHEATRYERAEGLCTSIKNPNDPPCKVFQIFSHTGLTEFPLVLKSRGPGTSSSMKLGSFLLFKNPLTTIRVSSFFFGRVSLFIY